MRNPRLQALGPLVNLLVLWFLHNELLYVSAKQGLVEKVIGGGGGVSFGTLVTAMAFIVIRGLLYLLGPGFALLTVRHLIWPARPAMPAPDGAPSCTTL